MHNNEGERYEEKNSPDDSRPSSASESTAVAVRLPGSVLRGITEDILGKEPGETAGMPTEVRRVRRGKFFLSRYEQSTFGSMRRPIFDYYCHGVVVGETVPDEAKDGIWCYAAHNDFDLIPEFTPQQDWPEYTRTPTGWIRTANPVPAIENLLDTISKLKRLT